jgi:hypothetical protein
MVGGEVDIRLKPRVYWPPKLSNLLKRRTTEDILWGSSGKDAHLLAKFCRLFGRMNQDDFGLVLFMAQKMAKRKAV